MMGGLMPLCMEMGTELTGPDGAGDYDRSAFLLGLSGEETSWGDRWCAGRWENAYARGGYYYKTSPDQMRLVQKYEDLAACSWGPWQILPVVAYEVGFRGEPWYLADPRESAHWVVKRFNEKCFTKTIPDGAGGFKAVRRDGVTWEKMFAFWNGGPSTLADDFWNDDVKGYVSRQIVNFNEAKRLIRMNIV